jgi:hypothetical protein
VPCRQIGLHRLTDPRMKFTYLLTYLESLSR